MKTNGLTCVFGGERSEKEMYEMLKIDLADMQTALKSESLTDKKRSTLTRMVRSCERALRRSENFMAAQGLQAA